MSHAKAAQFSGVSRIAFIALAAANLAAFLVDLDQGWEGAERARQSIGGGQEAALPSASVGDPS
ncbi:MAG TPA: hypothetical protein VFF52_01770 [Isosphaeraceae bacterium]|nr:hypothetical protein [Isosphaeraceae bacterium]